MLPLKIILAVAFILAGGAKLFKAKPMVDQFQEFGLPNNMVQIIGGLEVLGAVSLLIPSLAWYAAMGLAFLMVGAVANHMKVIHPLKTMAPSMILGLASVVLSYLLH